MRKPRVLHITSMFPTKDNPAFGIFIKTQIESLKNEIDSEVIVIPGKSGIFRYFKILPTVFKKIKNNNYDVIHAHFGHVGSVVKLINYKQIPIITSYCGGDLLGKKDENGKHELLSYILLKINKILSHFDTVSLVKSVEMANVISKQSKNIEVIPNGVDLGKFKPLDKDNCLKDLGITKDSRKILLFPADVNDPNKNFTLIKNALKNIDKEKFQLITFKGKNVPFEDIPKYLNISDLIVFSSLSEGSPNIIKEAMACNCKILSSKCGDVEWLLEGVEGSKTLNYSPSEWEREINTQLYSTKEIKSNSREKLIKLKLDSKSIAERVKNLYIKIKQ